MMPPMKRLSVLLLLLLLVGLSAPVTADPSNPCVLDTCLKNQRGGCNPVEFTGGDPGLKLWPFLNMIDINLSCITSRLPA